MKEELDCLGVRGASQLSLGLTFSFRLNRFFSLFRYVEVSKTPSAAPSLLILLVCEAQRSFGSDCNRRQELKTVKKLKKKKKKTKKTKKG